MHTLIIDNFLAKKEWNFLITFYKKKFQGLGYKVFDCFEEKRNDRYLSYLVFSLKK